MEKCDNCSKELAYGKISINRFISKLDILLQDKRYDEALDHINYWKNEAIKLNDERSLLSILNEVIGFSRRINNIELGFNAIEEALELIDKLDISTLNSTATILVNIATTKNQFGAYLESIDIYNKAQEIFKNNNFISSYEYAALLNNKSCAYANAYKYKEAKECINEAISILENLGGYDGDIALSLLNLAHVTYDEDDNSTLIVETLLDKAWEKINSTTLVRDKEYAFMLSKCIDSFKYFKRDLEAIALEEVIKEIYEEK